MTQYPAPGGEPVTMDAPRVPTTPLRYLEDATVGDECWTPSFTVTDDVVAAYARVSGDHNPLHADETYAAEHHFGGRVAHGLLGLALTDGLKSQSDYRFHPGMSLGWTVDFVAPIPVGDTVRVRFWVESLRPSRSRPEWGIVVLPSDLVNQDDHVVQRSVHTLMIPRRPQR